MNIVVLDDAGISVDFLDIPDGTEDVELFLRQNGYNQYCIKWMKLPIGFSTVYKKFEKTGEGVTCRNSVKRDVCIFNVYSDLFRVKSACINKLSSLIKNHGIRTECGYEYSFQYNDSFVTIHEKDGDTCEFVLSCVAVNDEGKVTLYGYRDDCPYEETKINPKELCVEDIDFINFSIIKI
jgi:hypothetical protein